MKKILHILNGLGSGGAEAFAINTLSALEKKDVKIDFLIRTEKGNIYFDDVKRKKSKVMIAPEFPKSAFKNNVYMKRFFFEDSFDYDVVHIHANSLVYMIPLRLLQRLKKKKEVKIILHSHNTRASGWGAKVIHLFNKKLLKEENIHAVACSKPAGKWMFKNNYDVVANGVNLKKFQFDSNVREDMRRELNLDKTDIVIGNVGRLTYQKNHMLLLDVFKKLSEKTTNYKLLLVGDGELKQDIFDKIAEYNLEDKVILTGAVTNVNRVYQAMDLFLMTSFYEGLPVSLVEAQASGLNIIVPSEAVGKDANLLGKISYLSLNDSLDNWVSEIEKLALGYNRSIAIENIEDSGFGLSGLEKKLCELYEC